MTKPQPRHLRPTANPTERKNRARLAAVESVGAFLRHFGAMETSERNEMTVAQTSGYYAPMTTTQILEKGAWQCRIGQTPDGKWVAEYTSTASARYQRHYFDTEAAAVADASWLR